jgi:hypothetical protein
MICFGLKPYKLEDTDEAMAILRALLSNDGEEENDHNVEEAQETKETSKK